MSFLSKRYEILQSLKLLASPPSIQISAFPRHVVIADEIALEFDNAVAFCREDLINGSLFPKYISDGILAIEKIFNSMSKSSDFWSTDSLLHNEEWASIRSLAKDLLEALGEDIDEAPDMSNLKFPTK